MAFGAGCVEFKLVLQAVALSSFLLPMLEYVPEQRATAAQMQQHPWLTGKLPSLSSQAGDRHRSAPSSSSPRLVKRSRYRLMHP